MGYIFDAISKQRGEEPQDPKPGSDIQSHLNQPQAQQDDTGQAGDGIAAAMASAEQAPEQEDAPLRLSDVKLRFDSDNNATVSAQAANNLDGDIDAPAQTSAPAQAPAAAATPIAAALVGEFDEDIDTQPLQLPEPNPQNKGGWWYRLLGKHLRGKVDDRLVTMTSPASAMSEEYRSIRTSILARHENERHLVHTITSATPQEGKTITCVNLGLSFAELRNRKTIIIECDLRLPTFGKLLNCDTNRPGLIDYLRGEAKLGEVIQQIEGSSLHIIPAGGRVSDEAVQLLSSARMSRLIQGLRGKYDHVLIDTPPVLQLADAGILGSQSEEVLLVARMRRTPRTLVEQAVNTLTSYNAVVNGIIATDNPRTRRGYGYKYGYGYGYRYGYGYTDERKRRKQRDAA